MRIVGRVPFEGLEVEVESESFTQIVPNLNTVLLTYYVIALKFQVRLLLTLLSASHAFHMERLKSMAGYASLPTVDDALSYVLPPFELASHRIVQIGHRLWELWSPNSSRVEFYPGTAISGFPFEHELHQLRRADGHRGRFDPTINPQVLDHARLWYPFVRVEAPVEQYPEFTNFVDVWDGRGGSFHASFLSRLLARMEILEAAMEIRTAFEKVHPDLWAARPHYTLREDVRALGAVSSYYEALDQYSDVQRKAKLASAWVKMVHALLEFPPAKAANMVRVVPARLCMMGAWINGSTKEDGWWLLNLGIPCHIIHERDTYWDYRLTDSSMRVHTFLAGTKTNDRLSLAADADVAMREHGWNLVDPEDDYGRASTEPPSSFQDRVHSSLRGQGWLFGKYTGPPVLFPDFTETMGYLVPPPVAAIGPGRWEHWVEDISDEGHHYMAWHGRRNLKEHGGKIYYDRLLLRILHFDHNVHPLRHYIADPNVFGLHVPDYPFYCCLQNNQLVERPRSRWMYRSKDPMRGDVGREYYPSFAKSANHYGLTDSEDDGSFDEDSGGLMGSQYTPADIDQQDSYRRRYVPSLSHNIPLSSRLVRTMHRDLPAPQRALNDAACHLEDLNPVNPLHPPLSDLRLLTVVILSLGRAALLLVDDLVLGVETPSLPNTNASDKSDRHHPRAVARALLFIANLLLPTSTGHCTTAITGHSHLRAVIRSLPSSVLHARDHCRLPRRRVFLLFTVRRHKAP